MHRSHCIPSSPRSQAVSAPSPLYSEAEALAHPSTYPIIDAFAVSHLPHGHTLDVFTQNRYPEIFLNQVLFSPLPLSLPVILIKLDVLVTHCLGFLSPPSKAVIQALPPPQSSNCVILPPKCFLVLHPLSSDFPCPGAALSNSCLGDPQPSICSSCL